MSYDYLLFASNQLVQECGYYKPFVSCTQYMYSTCTGMQVPIGLLIMGVAATSY